MIKTRWGQVGGGARSVKRLFLLLCPHPFYFLFLLHYVPSHFLFLETRQTDTRHTNAREVPTQVGKRGAAIDRWMDKSGNLPSQTFPSKPSPQDTNPFARLHSTRMEGGPDGNFPYQFSNGLSNLDFEEIEKVLQQTPNGVPDQDQDLNLCYPVGPLSQSESSGHPDFYTDSVLSSTTPITQFDTNSYNGLEFPPCDDQFITEVASPILPNHNLVQGFSVAEPSYLPSGGFGGLEQLSTSFPSTRRTFYNAPWTQYTLRAPPPNNSLSPRGAVVQAPAPRPPRTRKLKNRDETARVREAGCCLPCKIRKIGVCAPFSIPLPNTASPPNLQTLIMPVVRRWPHL